MKELMKRFDELIAEMQKIAVDRKIAYRFFFNEINRKPIEGYVRFVLDYQPTLPDINREFNFDLDDETQVKLQIERASQFASELQKLRDSLTSFIKLFYSPYFKLSPPLVLEDLQSKVRMIFTAIDNYSNELAIRVNSVSAKRFKPKFEEFKISQDVLTKNKYVKDKCEEIRKLHQDDSFANKDNLVNARADLLTALDQLYQNGNALDSLFNELKHEINNEQLAHEIIKKEFQEYVHLAESIKTEQFNAVSTLLRSDIVWVENVFRAISECCNEHTVFGYLNEDQQLAKLTQNEYRYKNYHQMLLDIQNHIDYLINHLPINDEAFKLQITSSVKPFIARKIKDAQTQLDEKTRVNQAALLELRKPLRKLIQEELSVPEKKIIIITLFDPKRGKIGGIPTGGHSKAIIFDGNKEAQWIGFGATKQKIGAAPGAVNALARNLHLPANSYVGDFSNFEAEIASYENTPGVTFAATVLHCEDGLGLDFEAAQKHVNDLLSNVMHTYDFMQNNCASIVGGILKAAGAENLVPPDYRVPLIGTPVPDNVQKYAKKVSEVIWTNKNKLQDRMVQYKQPKGLLDNCLSQIDIAKTIFSAIHQQLTLPSHTRIKDNKQQEIDREFIGFLLRGLETLNAVQALLRKEIDNQSANPNGLVNISYELYASLTAVISELNSKYPDNHKNPQFAQVNIAVESLCLIINHLVPDDRSFVAKIQTSFKKELQSSLTKYDENKHILNNHSEPIRNILPELNSASDRAQSSEPINLLPVEEGPISELKDKLEFAFEIEDEINLFKMATKIRNSIKWVEFKRVDLIEITATLDVKNADLQEEILQHQAQLKRYNGKPKYEAQSAGISAEIQAKQAQFVEQQKIIDKNKNLIELYNNALKILRGKLGAMNCHIYMRKPRNDNGPDSHAPIIHPKQILGDANDPDNVPMEFMDYIKFKGNKIFQGQPAPTLSNWDYLLPWRWGKVNRHIELDTKLQLNKIFNSDKLEPHQKFNAIQQKIDENKPHWLQFWRSDERSRYEKLEAQAKALCLFEAFGKGGLTEDELLEQLHQLAQKPNVENAAQINQFAQSLSLAYKSNKQNLGDVFKDLHSTRRHDEILTAAKLLKLVFHENNGVPKHSSKLNRAARKIHDYVRKSGTGKHSEEIKSDKQKTLASDVRLVQDELYARRWGR